MDPRVKTWKLYARLPKTPAMITPEELEILDPEDQLEILRQQMGRALPKGVPGNAALTMMA